MSYITLTLQTVCSLAKSNAITWGLATAHVVHSAHARNAIARVDMLHKNENVLDFLVYIGVNDVKKLLQLINTIIRGKSHKKTWMVCASLR